MPKISVVVPVYGGEKYLGACIESILGQTFKDFELLLLDDGSPDRSGEICDEYARKDGRVRVIHKENEGINATRRRGVHEAAGEWVAFCDDDDTMEPDALESMYALVGGGAEIVSSFAILPDKRLPADADLDTCRKAFLNGELSPTPWAKLYKRQLLTDEVFNFPRDIDGEEDMIMNTRLFFKTSVPPKVLYKHVYNFRRNTASVSHTKKASVSHEEAFYRALYDSIPQGERIKYMSQIVFLKLNGLFPIAFHNPLAVASDKSGYITTLREEVKQFDYRPSLKERVLLYSRSTIILRATGFLELLRRFLKYHLS